MVRVDYKTILSIDRVSILQRAFGSQDKTSGSAVNKNKNVDSKHKQEVLLPKQTKNTKQNKIKILICYRTRDITIWELNTELRKYNRVFQLP